MSDNRLLEWALLGMSAGGIGASGALFVNLGMKPADTLSFLGALVGAAVTILGASALAQASTKREGKAERRILVRDYNLVLRQAKEVILMTPAPHITTFPLDYRTGIHDLDNMSRELDTITEEALVHAKHLTFRQRASLRRAQHSFKEYIKFHDDVFNGSGVDDHWEERTWERAVSSVQASCEEVLRELASSASRDVKVPHPPAEH